MRRSAMVVALVPPAALIAYLWRFAVDVPYWDQWELVPLLRGAHDGTLRFADFFALHNEHRLLFPKLIMVPLALATRWRIGAELAVSVAIAGGLFATLAALARRADGARVTLPLVSLMVFSLAQRENWLWGWQIQIFLDVAAIAGAIVLLTGDARSYRRELGAFALGAVASFSFANGLLAWPIGLAILLARRRFRSAIGWTLGGAALTALYLRGYVRPPHAQVASGAGARAIDFAAYVLAYLGAPLAAFGRRAALVAGAVGLAAFGWITGRTARARGLDAVLAPAALASYSVGSAVLTAFGRSGFGLWQALASRYTTISNLLWIALVLSIAPRVVRARSAAAVALAVIAGLTLHESVRGGFVGARSAALREAARAQLLDGRGELLPLLYPSLPLLRERAAWLEGQRLSVYR